MRSKAVEQGREAGLAVAVGQQADIFGEHAKQAAGEEFGDGFGRVACLLEGLGEFCEVVGYVPRDFRAALGGIERGRVGPDELEPLTDFLIAQLLKADAIGERIGKGLIAERILTEEGPGVLNFMLDGLDALRNANWDLRLNAEQQGRVDNLLLESDSVRVFATERLFKDSGDRRRLRGNAAHALQGNERRAQKRNLRRAPPQAASVQWRFVRR